MLVTVCRNDVDRARVLNDGVVCYLRKSVDQNHAIRRLRAVLRSAGRGTHHVTEMACRMALVGKARGISNFRQREVRLSQHLLRALDPLLREVVVRVTPIDCLNCRAK